MVYIVNKGYGEFKNRKVMFGLLCDRRVRKSEKLGRIVDLASLTPGIKTPTSKLIYEADPRSFVIWRWKFPMVLTSGGAWWG